jgi:hypothetical protein
VVGIQRFGRGASALDPNNSPKFRKNGRRTGMDSRTYQLMARRISALLFVLGLLSGCVSQNMNAGLQGLLGRDIHVAVDKLGYPNQKRQMLGDTIYVWAISDTSMGVVPITDTTTGHVGSVPIAATTTSYVPTVENLHCEIELAVGANNIIKHWEWRGNMGACAGWANRLKPET